MMFESEFNETINHNKILEKHIELLRNLSDDRIMCVGYNHDGSFYLMECCDEYFYHDLTREECIELSNLFHDIALSMPPNYSEINLIKEIENGLLEAPAIKEDSSYLKRWVYKPPTPKGFII